MSQNSRKWLAVLAVSVLACCCCLTAAIALGSFWGYNLLQEQAGFVLPERVPPQVPELHLPATAGDWALLETMTQGELPPRDQLELGVRLGGLPADTAHGPAAAPPERALGQQDTFWVSDYSDPERVGYFQAEAELRHVSEHAYFWVETAYKRSPTDEALAAAGRAFDRTYETNHRYFGSEWSPGIDGETRVHIYNGRVPGVGGYFSSADEYPASINPHSNEREIFYVNLDSIAPGDALYSAVLAHEFTHMIQWRVRGSEDGWVDEGQAELAMPLNGYPTDGAETIFALRPDTQLNAWSEEPSRSYPHYGASYLFTSYFFDRFGPAALAAFMKNSQSGMAAFDDVLASQGLSFDKLFSQWTVANAVPGPLHEALPYGRSAYANRHPGVRMAAGSYPSRGQGEVHQYAADYLLLSPPSSGAVDLRIAFDGTSRTRLLPTQAPEGQAFWYANRGDDRNMTLTRPVDLSGLSRATLTFSTWYHIEDGWDFGYVEVSEDGGQTWRVLRGASSSDKNPVGNSFGPGYTGVSGGRKGDEPRWLDERVDLSPYAGQEVLLRFEYITDDAQNAPGWALDAIAIPELGFADNAEQPDSGWEANGFVRCTNWLPQRFVVQVIAFAGQEVQVHPMALDDENRGEFSLQGLGGPVERAVVVISALTPVTTEWGYYRYEISPAEPAAGALRMGDWSPVLWAGRRTLQPGWASGLRLAEAAR
ncbi:MAG: hypothetical protein GX605_00195 [Chloroflexi bacterium]|nr:hypothetical protein [Chloroflexota bacterium]